MKEITFEPGEFTPFSNKDELRTRNPEAQAHQMPDNEIEAEKDKKAVDMIREELLKSPHLWVILPVAGELQNTPNNDSPLNNQESPKHDLSIEEAVVMVLFAFIELGIRIFKNINNKAKSYFLNQKGIFDGPGKMLLEKSLARRPQFHFLRPDSRI